MKDSQTRDLDATLHEIVAGTAAVIGDAFFEKLVKHLATALGVGWAFVSEFTPGRARVRTLASWGEGRLLENEEYDLEGTPCEAVLAGETCLYTHGVAGQFPGHPELAEMGAESYLAMPLMDMQGQVMGHLAIIDDKPYYGAPSDIAIFKVFVARVAADGNPPGLPGVFVLAMAALCDDLIPSVLLDHTDYISHLHGIAIPLPACPSPQPLVRWAGQT